ncbi:hypothetical protein [Nonomuraea sp. NPDC023979]|uniref:hypothetical protein n=1 Tax=Nonomuraea sp. NPDC023979 TaxID=3154796 RepID=UPI00340531AF
MRRLATVVAALLLAAGPLATPGAAAGGFAVTYLDPLPGNLQAGTSYTAGYWVLQHGNHPYQGDLGPTGLRLTDARGEATLFAGTPLPEPGHYAAALTVPAAGTYRVEGIQGIFAPYAVGTLTVPGGLALNPLQPGLARALKEPQNHWGAIRPPGFPPGRPTPDPEHPAPGTPDRGDAELGAAEEGRAEPGAAVASPLAAGPSPGTRPSGTPYPAEAATGDGAAPREGAATDRGAAPALPGGADPNGGAVTQGGAATRGGAGSGGVPVYGLVVAAVGGAVLALVAVRGPWGRREPEPPVDDETDTITIGG